MSVRMPPRPPYEHVAGACSMCGTSPLPGRRRSWCSDACVELWNLATFPLVQRRHLEYFMGTRCWVCDARWQPGYARPSWSTDLGPPAPRPIVLEVEHVRPLWSLTDDERRELRWWLPFNLQLLCLECHRAKTRREAAARARLRRGDPAPADVEQLEIFGATA